MTSNKNQIDDETLQRVVSLRTYMAKRAETLKIELEEVTGFLEALDNAIASISFRRPILPDLVSETSVDMREKYHHQTIPLKSKSGVLLADLLVNETILRVVPRIKFNVSTPPFQSFMINRILNSMRQKDRERAEKGEISIENILSYNVIVDGDDLEEVLIKNYGDSQRLREIRSAVRWTLEKMFEKIT
jgi:hypothetical protein